MAELNPVRLWRRILALPNESRTKTVTIAFAVSVVCATMVTAATVILRPIKAQNLAMEQQAQLEGLLKEISGLTEVLAGSKDMKLSSVIVDLRRGQAARNVPPENLDAALANPNNWTALSPQEDTVGLGKRANLKRIHIVRNAAGAVELVMLPISGTGYAGPIEAILAVKGDMNTVAGLAVTSHSETPGLGGRIEERAWRRQFIGKRIEDEAGKPRLAVARGAATNSYEVDAITGATRTNAGMTRMLQFWLGPLGYGPLLDAARRGEF